MRKLQACKLRGQKTKCSMEANEGNKCSVKVTVHKHRGPKTNKQTNKASKQANKQINKQTNSMTTRKCTLQQGKNH